MDEAAMDVKGNSVWFPRLPIASTPPPTSCYSASFRVFLNSDSASICSHARTPLPTSPTFPARASCFPCSGPAPVAPGQRSLTWLHGEGATRHQPGRSALHALRRLHAETHRQFRSVLGLWPVSTLPGDAEKNRVRQRRKINERGILILYLFHGSRKDLVSLLGSADHFGPVCVSKL